MGRLIANAASVLATARAVPRCRWSFLVRDRDTTFTAAFRTVLADAGVRILKIAPRGPQAKTYAQRWVRTARTECLDWVLVTGPATSTRS